ncbi:MAG: hypothetical protein HYX92_04765 [Chloroflexi bacterium]|nr:hypothetical protein [Chloroflexota bacterium]
MAPWTELFRHLDEAHVALVGEFKADSAVIEGLREVRACLSEEAARLGAHLWEKEPEPGEWSLRQMLEHLLAHDRKWEEGRTKGVSHYVDHGRVHMEQAAKIRRTMKGNA